MVIISLASLGTQSPLNTKDFEFQPIESLRVVFACDTCQAARCVDLHFTATSYQKSSESKFLPSTTVVIYAQNG